MLFIHADWFGERYRLCICLPCLQDNGTRWCLVCCAQSSKKKIWKQHHYIEGSMHQLLDEWLVHMTAQDENHERILLGLTVTLADLPSMS